MRYCSRENETGALLFLGGRNRCNNVLRRSDLVLYCSRGKEMGALLFLGGRNLCSTVFR